MVTPESEPAVLREVVAGRDRLLQELRAEALPLREQVACLTATGEHPAAPLQDTKVALKEFRPDCRPRPVMTGTGKNECGHTGPPEAFHHTPEPACPGTGPVSQNHRSVVII